MSNLNFAGWTPEAIVEMVRIYRETHEDIDDYNAVSAVCQDIPLPDWQVDHLADAALKILEAATVSTPWWEKGSRHGSAEDAAVVDLANVIAMAGQLTLYWHSTESEAPPTPVVFVPAYDGLIRRKFDLTLRSSEAHQRDDLTWDVRATYTFRRKA